LERLYGWLGTGRREPQWLDLFTGNVGLRRADFLAVGGFDDRLARQEDIELGYRLDRLGCRFEFDSAAVVWHDSQRSLATWMRIPAATARSDVEMDRLDPDSARLSAVRERLSRQHWALRLMRRIVRGQLAYRCVVAAAMTVGRLLHAVRADRAAFAACSLVYDLTYWQALQEASSTADTVRAPV
jgi:hypothetical protein